MKKMKLICIPYAGGLANTYNRWKDKLDPSIELVPIELSGRGKRLKSPLYDSLNEAVDDLFDCIKDEIVDSNYAIFGHSMGAFIAYELVYKIQKLGYPMPSHMIISGRNAPGKFSGLIKFSSLSDDKFKRIVRRLGGTPKELLNNNDVFNIFLPILKSDFRNVEKYKFRKNPDKLSVDISIFAGAKEKCIKSIECMRWQKYFVNKCKLYVFSGGHFFIHENREDVVNTINKILLEN